MMKPVRRKTTRKTRASKRPQRRGGNRRFITRAEARRRAERHVLKRMFKGATVRAGEDVRLGIYFRGGWTAKDVWVVYKNPEEISLKSSDMVLVSKRTGRVLYEGSAHDEG
ncbi:MAG: hypothetical protein MUF81_12415 [Verrucomicrobia bacterium]|jgi:hypothetical protein|nr:hypothetical protein [Verrucomicrobiota bacterium]